MNGVIHRLEICTIVFAMNCGMDYWVSYSFYSPASSQKKLKSMKKHGWWVTALMSLEQTAITYNSFGVLQSNKDFRAPLLGQIRWYQGFNCWQLPLPRTMRVKSLRIFFQNMQSFTQCISMLYTEKSVLRYYVRFSQVRSQLIRCTCSSYVCSCSRCGCNSAYFIRLQKHGTMNMSSLSWQAHF